MHSSVWRFEGDPDDLEQRYLAMLADVPESNHTFHAAAKTPEGLLIFDTCPSEEVYRQFFGPGGPAAASSSTSSASTSGITTVRGLTALST